MSYKDFTIKIIESINQGWRNHYFQAYDKIHHMTHTFQLFEYFPETNVIRVYIVGQQKPTNLKTTNLANLVYLGPDMRALTPPQQRQLLPDGGLPGLPGFPGGWNPSDGIPWLPGNWIPSGETPEVPGDGSQEGGTPPSEPISKCQSQAEIREFFRTSIKGSPIKYNTIDSPVAFSPGRYRSYNAITGEVIVSGYSINVSDICTVTTDISPHPSQSLPCMSRSQMESFVRSLSAGRMIALYTTYDPAIKVVGEFLYFDDFNYHIRFKHHPSGEIRQQFFDTLCEIYPA
ncbi:hypothetical protein [Virgibacillus litoralis]|uniref:Uncharacterized protein n=1 Tax=Virgibacillus litoralis TaxID=578221 RepID=A0ABS4H8G6_9BACI|nr:hypothetical protein [Virgibacillus litoralis]MBP1947163.1 hypothetical protein [Virgibacillus litoralis]